MHKICVQELFNANRVQSFTSIREDEFSMMVETIKSANGKLINFSKLISTCTSSIVNRAAFGEVRFEPEGFVELIKQVFALAGGFKLVDLFPSCKIIYVLEVTERKL